MYADNIAACIHSWLLLSVIHAAINQYLLPAGPQQQTCSSGLAVGPRWDRQTVKQMDRQTDGRTT